MDSTIIASNEKDLEIWWESKKKELLDSIHATIQEGVIDKEVLEIMKEMVENARVRSSIRNYYEETEDKEV